MHSKHMKSTPLNCDSLFLLLFRYSVLIQASNMELSKSTPKLAAAETALARVTARAQQASEIQADLRASFTAGARWID